MSVHVSSWVWAQVVGDPEAKLVLLKLADQANDDGECWPSRRTIAEACETSVSTVKRRLNYLSEKKLLVVEERQRPGGLQSTNLYTIPYRSPLTSADVRSGAPPSAGSTVSHREPPGGSVGEPPGGSVGEPPGGSVGEPPGGSTVTHKETSVEASVEASVNREHATRIYTKLEQEREDRLIAEAEEHLHPETIADSKAENAAQLAKLRSELRL